MTSMEKLLQEKNCYLRDRVLSILAALNAAEDKDDLLSDQAVKTAYEAAIYEITERLGPYYVLCENLALIHASNQSGVNDTQMAVTVLKEPVKFKPDGYDVRVLVTLVAKDSESHMEGIQAVSNIFSDEKKVQEILDATCPKEIFDLFVSNACEK